MSEQAPILEAELPDLDASSTGEDSIRRYFNDISQTPLLSAEEEVMLCKRIEAGVFAGRILDLQAQIVAEPNELTPEDKLLADKYRPVTEDLKVIAADGQSAKNHMVQANLKLVVSIAKRYRGRGLDFQDLVQEGNLGLIHAVEKFDYQKGFKFSTYGTWWIRQTVSRGLAEKSRTIRVPAHLAEEVNKMGRIKNSFFQDNGREATDQELADLFGTDKDKARLLKELNRLPVSLDKTLDDGDMTISDILEDKMAVQPENAILEEMANAKVLEAIDTLQPREALIIKRRYGIGYNEPQKLDQVGKELGVTRERVRQIQKKAEESLRSIFRKKGITSFHDY